MNRPSAIRTAVALLCSALASAHAATYYVNSSSGNDTNSGTTTSLTWKTLSKANASVTSGDTVLLSGGAIWQETLNVKAGVTYSTYGSTSRAIISGSRPITSRTWTRAATGSNIWYITTTPQIESGSVSQVLVNGLQQTRARTPNIGKGDWAVTSSRYAKVAKDGNDTTLNLDAGVVPATTDINGATVFARNDSSDLSEYTVTATATTPIGLNSSGQAVTLPLAHVSRLDDWGNYDQYPIPAGTGYWLENKLWMLDAPGEWYFDAAAHRLYLWMPSSVSPNVTLLPIAVSSQANGIFADGVSNFKISNITVQETMADGIYMNHTSGATLNNIAVMRAGRRGISMADSQNNTISNSLVDHSQKDGIWLGFVETSNTIIAPKSRRSTNTTVTNTQITNAGNGGYSVPGVRLGEGGSFTNNVVSNSPSIGIIATLGNDIRNNLILNSCTNFDDCGGIYVQQPATSTDATKTATGTDFFTKTLFANKVSIVNNIVDGGSGSIDGVPTGGGTDTRGIYLDDYTNGVTVTGNYVTGMRYAFMLHTSSNNTLSGNLALNNRSSNLLLQEGAVGHVDSSIPASGGAMAGNVIKSNAMVASKGSVAIPNILQSAEGGYGPTGNFAHYDLNRYTSLNANAPSVLAYNYGSDVVTQSMTLATWQSIGQDLQGVFYPYQTTREAWGFYNPSNATSSKTISSIPASATPTGTFLNLLTGASVTLPISLPAGTSIILVK